MNTQEILNQLKKDGSIDLETESDMLAIWFRKFFGTRREFHFQLNCKAIKGCKTDKAAMKTINQFLNKGFKLCENQF